MGHPLFYMLLANNCSHCYISSALHCQTTIIILLCHTFISQSDRNLQCGTDNNFKYSSESNGPIPTQRHKVTVQLCRSSWDSDETGFYITAVNNWSEREEVTDGNSTPQEVIFQQNDWQWPKHEPCGGAPTVCIPIYLYSATSKYFYNRNQ